MLTNSVSDFLAILMINEHKFWTNSLFHSYVGIHQVVILVFDQLPKVSSARTPFSWMVALYSLYNLSICPGFPEIYGGEAGGLTDPMTATPKIQRYIDMVNIT